MGRAVVLLGAPGSGKSSVGHELGLLGLRWREWEPELLARWGGREGFIAHKQAALAEHHGELLTFVDADHAPAILESTGISDAEFIDKLQEREDTFVVRLDVSEAGALRRIAARSSGRHLSDELEANRRVWAAFNQLVVPNRPVNFVVDTEEAATAAIALEILESLDGQGSERAKVY